MTQEEVSRKLHTLLSELPVYSKLTKRQLYHLESQATIKEYKEGEYIALMGDVWAYAIILLSGEIRFQKYSPEGRSLGAWRLFPFQCFWSPTLFDGRPLPATLDACKPCLVSLWPGGLIMPFVENNSQALWDLNIVLVQRMRHASEIVEDLAFQPVASRLARLLVKNFDPQAVAPIERSLTLEEMAAMIGTTPVMVCKVLSRFADDGIIKITRTEFEFLDHQKLSQIAGQANPTVALIE